VLALACSGCASPGIVGQLDAGARMDAGRDAGPRDGGFDDLDGTIGVWDGDLQGGIVPCQGHVYRCGNAVDDDDDGLIDDRDPDCLGPCSNNESGYFLGIPGGDSAPCRLDCYFDQDQGSGNDGCDWDHRCDPLEPDPDPQCAYTSPPPAGVTCPPAQSEECGETCAPLVPNGCDCFGCCELPARSGRYVFIGSVNADGVPTCGSDSVTSDADCHPCIPVGACLNTCATCELCLGRTELPPGCGEPDGGTLDVCGDPDRLDCGLPEHPPCPDGYFCVTGCCTWFG
jgi:hypothetical protein